MTFMRPFKPPQKRALRSRTILLSNRLLHVQPRYLQQHCPLLDDNDNKLRTIY